MQTFFVDMENRSNPANGTVLLDAESTGNLFDALDRNLPLICELKAENGYKLTIGLGTEIGFAQYSKTDGDPPYLVAVADGIVDRNHVFFIDGTETEISREHCLAYAVVREIAMFFTETGMRSDCAVWVEI